MGGLEKMLLALVVALLSSFTYLADKVVMVLGLEVCACSE